MSDTDLKLGLSEGLQGWEHGWGSDGPLGSGRRNGRMLRWLIVALERESGPQVRGRKGFLGDCSFVSSWLAILPAVCAADAVDVGQGEKSGDWSLEGVSALEVSLRSQAVMHCGRFVPRQWQARG